jgi:hypothetical protein
MPFAYYHKKIAKQKVSYPHGQDTKTKQIFRYEIKLILYSFFLLLYIS